MLIQNDPFRELDSLFSRLGGRTTDGSLAMPMDAYRRGETVWVHIDLPGVRAESLDISVERSVLTVVAERGWPLDEGDQVYLNERPQGTYRRQVHLGEGLDAGSIDATFDHGVLTLRIPVAEVAKPRKITVETKSSAVDVESSES